MSMFDTIDGCFMNFAYDWAFAKPIRKVFYNLTITGLSVFVAFFIGTIEILGLIGQEANLNDPFFNFFQNFNINTAGFVIVGAFVADVGSGADLLASGQRRSQMGCENAPQPTQRRGDVQLTVSVKVVLSGSTCTGVQLAELVRRSVLDRDVDCLPPPPDAVWSAEFPICEFGIVDR